VLLVCISLYSFANKNSKVGIYDSIDSLLIKADKFTTENVDSAFFYADQALHQATEADYQEARMKALLFLGNLDLKNNKPEDALVRFNKILYYAKQLNDPKYYLAMAYAGIGSVYHAYAENIKAITYFDSAKLTLTNEYYEKYIAKILNEKGNTYTSLSKYEKANKCFLEALKYAEKKSDTIMLSTVLINLASLNRNIDRYDKAQEYYDRALKYCELLNDKEGIAIIYQNKANIFSDKSNYQKAMHYYLFAKRIRDKQRIADKNYATLISNIGLNYAEQFIFDSALYYFNKSLEVSEAVKDTFGIADTKIVIGAVLLEQKKYGEALSNIKEGMKIARKIGAIYEYSNGIKFLIRYDTLTNNYKKAFMLQNEYHILMDSINNVERVNNINELNIKYETEKKEQQISLLKAENKLGQYELKQKAIQRNWMILFFIITLLVIVIIYHYYKKAKKDKAKIELLQREIHHRVKNNLSIIKRLVVVAKQNTEDTGIHSQLDELTNRIESISKVHSQLYRKKDITRIDLKDYISELCNDISRSFNKKDFELILSLEETIVLPFDKVIPLGLIVNELVTNAYKYAKTANSKSVISVLVMKKDGLLTLKISDNGSGFPKNLNLSTVKSYGMKMVNGLTHQLNGKISLINKNGASVEINFPI